LDAIREQGRRSSSHKPQSSIRFVSLGFVLILVLSWFVLGTGDLPVGIIATRRSAPPVEPPVSIAAPVTQPPVSATLDANKQFIPPEPDTQETTVPQEPAVAKPSEGFSLEGGSVIVRYLERRLGAGCTFPLLDKCHLGDGGTLAVGKLHAGYGAIFDDDSVITRGRNGTAWEETSFLFVKVSFRF
jgi:hypothetical protein